MPPERDEQDESPDSGPDLDMSWLLPDDDPHVVAHGRAVPPPSPSPSAVPPASSPPPPPPAPPVVGPRHGGWAAVGSAFQPVPGGPLLARGGPDRLDAVVLVTPGTPLHAVHAGVVHDLVGADGTVGRALHRDDGVVVGYVGDVVVDWTCRDGDRLPAGAGLGVVSGPGPEAPAGRALLHVTLSRPESGPVDAVGWLTGLPDPAELGMAPDDVDIGVDPFLTDLRLAGLLPDGTP